MNKIESFLLVLTLILFSPIADALSPLETTVDEIIWYEKDADQQPVIHLYFFWSKKCPHCLKAQPDVIEIDKELPWLKLHSFELVEHPENIRLYTAMAEKLGNDARSVPTFMFCGNLLSGYDKLETTGSLLRSYLQSCYQFARENDPDNKTVFSLGQSRSEIINLPLLGGISSSEYSLPVLTVFIAAMDAFNPCAFFVLLFLLSMMVHSRSRARMALIGGIFVFFSGAVYFLFMAAWLNLFLFLGELRFITLIAGCVAILIAMVNIKDYFWFKKGFSLSIPEGEKPKLIDRIRQLLKLDSIITVIFATVMLAIVANSYELLCTAGFPMVYTKILTMNALSSEQYYLYLLFYNLVYILPLLLIVTVFTIKLGSRKLAENEGMVLKLLSGVMMLLLGLLLIVSPQALNNVVVAFSILILAVGFTWAITKFSRK